jgi:class 3 adenylate cyclase
LRQLGREIFNRYLSEQTLNDLLNRYFRALEKLMN